MVAARNVWTGSKQCGDRVVNELRAEGTVAALPVRPHEKVRPG